MSFCRQSVLAAEGDVSGLGIHGVHDGQRFQMVSQVADDAAAGLESLLDGDADPFQGGAGLGDDGDQSLQRAAVGQKIIDDQDVVVWPQKFFGDDDLIFTLWVKDSTSATYISPSMLMLLDFLAKTTGAWKCLAVIQAMRYRTLRW